MEHPAPLHLLVHLTVAPGEESAFLAYERRALAILRRHGGRLLYALRPEPEADGTVREVHLLRLPSREALDTYRRDPALAALREMRAVAVATTSITSTADISHLYSADSASIRPAVPEDAAGIAHVHIASWRSTYRGIVPDAYLDALDVEARTRVHERRLAAPPAGNTTLVAEVEGEGIVGFAHAGPGRNEEPNVAEIYAIYMLEEWAGQGLGERLVRMLAPSLIESGMERLLIWVLAENRSRGFYERLGGKATRENTIDLGGTTLKLIAYEWESIQALLEEVK